MSLKHFYLAAAAAIIGCAPASRASDDSQVPTVPPTPHLLTAWEVASKHGETWTAHDAIARLRPNWLAAHGMSTFDSRGGTEYATVFIDGQWQRSGIDSLRNIPVSHVKDFRFYDVTEAGATFGLQAGSGGAIEVRMK
jgi:hypothetical protein